MNKARLYSILDKIRKGNSTKEERDMLAQWYESAGEADADELFDEVGNIIDEMDRHSLEALEKQLSAPVKTRVIAIGGRWRGIRIAAAVLVLVFATIAGYRYFKGNPASGLRYTAGKGETRHIRLPDGSEVTLNAGSSLEVPGSFGSAERKVLLNGEAFFAVSKNEKAPFSVMSEDSVLVEVLGTSFNISAYGSHAETKVAVSAGKVAVSRASQRFGILAAGQQLAYDKNRRHFLLINDDNAAAWLKGIVAFRGNTLNEVAETLSRTYDKQVRLKPGVDGELQITGNFKKEQGIDNILKMICALHHLEYAYEDGLIVIGKLPL